MTLPRYMEEMLPVVEQELRKQVQRLSGPRTNPFCEMLTYHMGWTGEGAGPKATGKRIRPLLMLLVVCACGGKWLRATPGAAAIELLHNFSLVHDDIEDNSPTRRGRTTAWKKYGLPMAVNVGDALFSISNLAMTDLGQEYPAEVALRAASVLQRACLSLTQGQYLDMYYEHRSDITEGDYWPMVAGKTAALLSACGEIGGVLGGAPDAAIVSYGDFARSLGLAFQVQDDILGLWGDEKATGKSASSDLVEGKNSLPILYGIGRRATFAKRWAQGPVGQEEVGELAQLLKVEGAYDYCIAQSKRLTDQALASLQKAEPQGEAGRVLLELVDMLLQRST